VVAHILAAAAGNSGSAVGEAACGEVGDAVACLAGAVVADVVAGSARACPRKPGRETKEEGPAVAAMGDVERVGSVEAP